MVEVQADAVERRLLQLLLLRLEVGVPQIAQGEFLFRGRGCSNVLWWLAAMEHEILDAASRWDVDEIPLEQPQQLLGRCLVDGGISGGHFADGEGISPFLVSEHDAPAAVSGFEPGHTPPVVWGQFGGNIGQPERNATALHSTRIAQKINGNQGFAACFLCRRNVSERYESWTVDPVVAGSSPVALAKQKYPQAKDLRLLSFQGYGEW